MKKRSLIIGLILVIIAICSRLVPHWHNFTAMNAVALFAGFHFRSKWTAVIIPISALWLSDIILNNTFYAAYFEHFYWGSLTSISSMMLYCLIYLIGAYYAQLKPLRLALSSVFGSVLFFIGSNFAVWLMSTMYPKDFTGLIACYSAGLPFLQNGVLGDLLYNAVIFGGFYWMTFRVKRFTNAIQK